MKTALIFGSNGQDGYFLTELLKNASISSYGASRKNAELIGDVGNYEFVSKSIQDLRPDYIFHLAANSTTRHDALFENHHSISTGTLNILEASKNFSPHSKIFISGSAMQFKNTGIPISEATEFEASSPYSISRIHSVYAARYYRQFFGLKTYVGYFFNHDSHLRSDRHVNQKISSSALRIGRGESLTLELGNIEVRKEFNYAGDVMDAVWLLVNQDEVFESVIGSGEAHSIQEWLEYCFKKVGKNWKDYISLRPGFKSEYDILVSDPKVIKNLGWKPKVSFEQLADMMMR